MLKDFQYHLHLVRRKAWKHRIALHHIDKAIPKMEKIIVAIHDMKMLRIQEYFEYKNAKGILKRNLLYTT
ncbi:hypothetical protein H5410_028471 [Solanum commersonii]|uniref:Uncharacterized protein n=1 Tax=Solanum commersonii TaxID=4109 RepID=A0A9J5Z217_SOLCO|nr:hypothetical protein H5410_028471 [Solanum commersonii]